MKGNVRFPRIESLENEGHWWPHPGYAWRRCDVDGHPAPGDLAVGWRSGLPNREFGRVTRPHIHSSEREREWMADPGWVFTGDDDLTVESEAEHQAALAEWQNLERRWMDYLARLEAQGDYTNWNWSGPPLELYLRSHPAAAALRPTDPATGGTNPQAEATRAAITDAQACFREFARRHNEARAHPPESTQQNGGASIQLEPSGPASPPNHTGSLALRSSALLPVRKLAALLARRNAVPFELAGTVAAVGLGLAAWAALRARRKQTA